MKANQVDLDKIRKSQPHIIIGKKGLSEGLIKHMEQLLKDHFTIKIKVLKTIAEYVEMEKIMEEIMRKFKIYVLDVRGHTAIITVLDNIQNLNYPNKYMEMRKRLDKEIAKETFKDTQTTSKGKEETYIDYEDEELMDKLDKQADKFYGKK